ncbi:PPOX class F420-dependent oxidoreductase [Dietzia sp. PP-33]|jgi:PPOX class probable F420-dependent enzyme|uniref:PPOX class F420-dependent oxidoreductase n=1 Tax=Dietzia sp. PP-33 TaxID=2957500 RepID=UPI0029ABEC09|nr:PPOX class F420-dependent oxidoreductase [Dietzia sp. PP-33]MDX2355387.1 PPOX class F420-dependent oxidoreductase [Dietzia sp. PP-33]
MSRTLADLSPEAHDFLAEYHLGSLTTLRRDGSPHVVAVGFTVDTGSGLARVITRHGSQKARNARRGGRAAVSHVDRGRWLTFEGPVRLLTDEDSVREAERRYGLRYRVPRPNPERVVVAIEVDRVLGSAQMFTGSGAATPH